MKFIAILTGVLLINVERVVYSFISKTPSSVCRFQKDSTYQTSPSIISPSSLLLSSEGLTDSNWGVTDDWSSLSDATNTADSNTVFDANYAKKVADEMAAASSATQTPLSEEDIWIRDAVDEIYNSFSTLDDQPLYDTSYDEPSPTSYSIEESLNNDIGNEIAMLVRCNEQPESMLIAEGRALMPLTQEEKDDASQLVTLTKDTCEATDFLKNAVSKIFRQHAVPSVFDGVLSMDRQGVASWMTKSLKDEGKVSPHDKRVLKTLSDFSLYGSGRLVEKDLQALYLSTIVGDVSNLTSVSPKRHLQLRKPFIDSVWRDIRAHGLLSPVEEERLALATEMQERNGVNKHYPSNSNIEIMDECEILDWDFRASETKISARSHGQGPERRSSTRGLSSHEHVEMANDNKTPLWMRDGEFVFIDEESCIGCMQCVNVAPAAFVMLDSGRARTFHQRSGPDVDQAVLSCPVSCMHPVSYQELVEFEDARDKGDGRTDHKHLGHDRGHTPLYVAGIDSDNNHRSSWYHTLKQNCVISSQCPQKGCYDCPKFNTPGENPYFIAKHKQAEHVRAQHFIENGDVDAFRKIAEL